MSKVLVIGCGNVGSVGLHKMAQTPKIFSEIHVVGRTQSKCEAVRCSVLKKSKGKVDLKIHVSDVGKDKNFLNLLKEIQQSRAEIAAGRGKTLKSLKDLR